MSSNRIITHSFHRQSVGPTLRKKVQGFLNEHKVTLLDYCLNGFTTAVGIALTVFTIRLYINMRESLTWQVRHLPYHLLLACMGVTGTILTLLSIKWIAETYELDQEFKRVVNEALHRR